MNLGKIKYSFNDDVKIDELKSLMLLMNKDKSTQFPAEDIFHFSLRNNSKEFIALANGTNVTARSEKDELIGYLRVISDKAYIYTIVDVMVRPDMQKKKVGTKLLNLTIEKIKQTGFIKIFLTALPGKESFYEQIGFKKTMSPVFCLRGEDFC